MTGASFTFKATVPVVVWANDDEIFCNSTSGYHLYAVNGEGQRRHIETYVGATKKPNEFERFDDETWEILAR